MEATNTFSVAGRCPETGALGVIVTSSSPAVGSRCAWGKNDVGVILPQNVTDPRLATVGLTAMEQGYNADAAIRTMKEASDYPEYRQLAVVDKNGESAVFTGDKALGVSGEFCSDNVASIGNLLKDPDIPQAMGEKFLQENNLSLSERLISAIDTGFEMGGELDQEHSIALLVYKDVPFPYVDLRVDYSEDPLNDLKNLWEIYKPQAEDYKVRALNPVKAPSYGVKGDE
ncbi:DUF1028 domain-containing protein [Lentibacillus halophilus]|uniref:DUF1028 domain-containing protein n=1 Tax=Lentibacillus halophilus TaxID=295065 RepID=A0ABP3IVK0_9BACI